MRSIAALSINRTSVQGVSNSYSANESSFTKQTETLSKTNIQEYAGPNHLTLGTIFK